MQFRIHNDGIIYNYRYYNYKIIKKIYHTFQLCQFKYLISRTYMFYQNNNLKIVLEIMLWYSVRRACRSVPLGFSDSSQLPPWSTGIGVSVYVMHLPWIAAYNFRAAICAATRSSSACECISGAIFSAFPREDEEKKRAVFPSVSSAAIVRYSAPRTSRNYISRATRWEGTPSSKLHHSHGCHLLKFKTPAPLYVKRMLRFRIESRCNFERKISRREITPARVFASSTLCNFELQRNYYSREKYRENIEKIYRIAMFRNNDAYNDVIWYTFNSLIKSSMISFFIHHHRTKYKILTDSFFFFFFYNWIVKNCIIDVLYSKVPACNLFPLLFPLYIF